MGGGALVALLALGGAAWATIWRYEQGAISYRAAVWCAGILFFCCLAVLVLG